MKVTLKALLALGLFISMGTAAVADSCCNDDCNDDCENSCSRCKTKFLPFSVGENRARDYANVTRYQFLPDEEDWNWYVSLAIEYQRNFDRCRLGSYFLPANNTLTVGPAGADGVDVRSVDLGLSSTFVSTLTIDPEITNWVIEPAFYTDLGEWINGLWFWFKVPVAHTRWTLGCCEDVTQIGGQYLTPNPSTFGKSSQNPQEAISSNRSTLPTPYATISTATNCLIVYESLIDALAGGETTCDMQALCAGKILCCSENKTRVADIPLHLGYNFINQDNGYLGVYGRLVIPTGRRADCSSLFTPAIGYSRWQAGVGFNGRIQLYDHDVENRVNLFGDIYATHIFEHNECRVFDIKNLGCMSRFALLKEANADGTYTGRLFHFSDKFATGIKSGFGWNIDALLFLDLQHKNWNFDLGYEFKYRSQETFNNCDCLELCDACKCNNSWWCSSSCNSISLNGKLYAVKGTTDLDGVGQAIAANPNGGSASTTPINGITTAGDTTTVFISEGNFSDFLDLDSGRMPSARSNKIWANLGYSWPNRDYPITAGIFGEVEFGNSNKAVSLWGIGAKAAIAYN